MRVHEDVMKESLWVGSPEMKEKDMKLKGTTCEYELPGHVRTTTGTTDWI